MVIIIFIVIGILLMFFKKVSVSSKSELRRPNTIIFGVILIIGALVGNAFSNSEDSTLLSVLPYAAPIILAILSIAFLKQPKLEIAPASNTADKTVNIITWTIVGAIGLGVLYMAFVFLTSK